MATIAVAIVADDDNILDFLSSTIEADPECSVVGVAAEPVLGRVFLDEPDLRVLIVSLSSRLERHRESGIDFIAKSKERRNDLGILSIEREIDASLVRAALEAGATACCLAAAPPSQLLRAIQAASVGATWLDREISEVVFRPALRFTARSRLTARERAVLQLIAEGYSNVKIAAQLHCSTGTIHTHVAHVFEKLGVNDRVSAVVSGLRQGLISEMASSPSLYHMTCERKLPEKKETA